MELVRKREREVERGTEAGARESQTGRPCPSHSLSPSLSLSLSHCLTRVKKSWVGALQTLAHTDAQRVCSSTLPNEEERGLRKEREERVEKGERRES